MTNSDRVKNIGIVFVTNIIDNDKNNRYAKYDRYDNKTITRMIIIPLLLSIFTYLSQKNNGYH